MKARSEAQACSEIKSPFKACSHFVMTGADGARVVNLNVGASEMSVPRLMIAIGESRGESSLGVTGRGFKGEVDDARLGILSRFDGRRG